jgi:mRNA interferase HigB
MVMGEMEPDEDQRKPKKNHLISRKSFRVFVTNHPEAAKDRPAFNRWCKVVEQALWTKFSDVKATFSSADRVGGLVVFNVGGNKYRVVAHIDYKVARVYIRHVLTHKEYDGGAWKSGP